MVQNTLKFGIKPCGRDYHTSVRTVRKWVNRYYKNKEDGLIELPRMKTNCSIKIDKETELQIIECRKKHPTWGARRIKLVKSVQVALLNDITYILFGFIPFNKRYATRFAIVYDFPVPGPAINITFLLLFFAASHCLALASFFL